MCVVNQVYCCFLIFSRCISKVELRTAKVQIRVLLTPKDLAPPAGQNCSCVPGSPRFPRCPTMLLVFGPKVPGMKCRSLVSFTKTSKQPKTLFPFSHRSGSGLVGNCYNLFLRNQCLSGGLQASLSLN